MTWIRIDKAFDFSPAALGGRVTIAYKPGIHNVTRECAKKARAAGVGKPVKSPKRETEGDDEHRSR